MANLAEQAMRLNRRARRVRARRIARGGFALLSDTVRLPDPVPLLSRMPVGGLLILRHDDAPGRAALARRLAVVCRARRLRLVIADDLGLAVALRAGLHLPEHRLRDPGARMRLWHRRTGAVLTTAAHGRDALVRAVAAGADAALLSPVFATASHPGAAPLGSLKFRLLVRGARLPVFALGGVSTATIRRLAGSGAAGVATVSGLT